MSDIVSVLVSIGIMVVEQLILFVLWGSVFQWKQNKAWAFIVAFLMLGAASFITNIFVSSAFAKLVIYFGLIFTLLRVLCNNEWYVLLFLSAVGIAYLKAVDNIILYLSCFVLKITPQASLENPYSFILFALLSKLIEFIGAWCFSKIFNRRWKKTSTHWQSWLQTLPLPVAACVFLSAALQMTFTQPGTAPLLLLLSFVFLFLCVLQLFIASRLDKQWQSEAENRQLQQSLTLQKESLQSLTEAYTLQRSLTHEFNNHLGVITSLAQQQNMHELQNYLERLHEASQNAALVVHTGNAVMDAVLNQKYRRAVQHDIAIDFDMTSLANFPLLSDELAVVISNLLDNAIEACASYDGERIIHLKIKIHDSQLLLMITNPTQKPPWKVDGKWVTSKDNPIFHGFGLSNVESILESFDAEYTSDYAKGFFSFVTFIPLA